jgi:hypothetical protein
MYNLALIKFVVSEKKALYKMAATAGLSLTLDPMGKVSQNASSLKPLGQLKPNCPGIMHSLGSISAIASEKKMFLYFPIWSCVNTMSMTCGGSHLGFWIGIKNPNCLEDLQMEIY